MIREFSPPYFQCPAGSLLGGVYMDCIKILEMKRVLYGGLIASPDNGLARGESLSTFEETLY